MSSEDLIAACAMGFIFGLFLFVAVYVRVRKWPSQRQPSRSATDSEEGGARYAAGSTIDPPRPGLMKLLEQLVIIDRFADLAISLFLVAMLLYGAIVAPRLRIVECVAGGTALLCWWCWRTVSRWLTRRPSGETLNRGKGDDAT